MNRIQYAGPRSACQALDKLADVINDEVQKIILDLAGDQIGPDTAKKRVEDHLAAVFLSPEMGGIRDYLHRGKRFE